RELNLEFTMEDLPHKKIKLEIQVVGHIKEFFPGERFSLELENPLTIRDILRRLKAKEELVGMVTVNGEPRDKDYVPGDGDKIMFMAFAAGG
ncbi:MoaD/ThiS family protein, partial [Candidatus Aerophobetes bacterium]